jgi:hypothetical protein
MMKSDAVTMNISVRQKLQEQGAFCCDFAVLVQSLLGVSFVSWPVLGIFSDAFASQLHIE